MNPLNKVQSLYFTVSGLLEPRNLVSPPYTTTTNMSSPLIPNLSWAYSQENQMLDFALIDVAGNLDYKGVELYAYPCRGGRISCSAIQAATCS